MYSAKIIYQKTDFKSIDIKAKLFRHNHNPSISCCCFDLNALKVECYDLRLFFYPKKINIYLMIKWCSKLAPKH